MQRGAEVEDEMEDAGHCREDGRDKKREGVDVAGEAVRAPVDAACVSGVRTMGRGGGGSIQGGSEGEDDYIEDKLDSESRQDDFRGPPGITSHRRDVLLKRDEESIEKDGKDQYPADLRYRKQKKSVEK